MRRPGLRCPVAAVAWAACTDTSRLVASGRVSAPSSPAAPLGSGRARRFFDAHRVRTLPEVLMVVVGTDDRIRRLELLRFQEPPDYRPPAAWLQLFGGRELDRQLSLKGGVAKFTGATLTADAVTDSARRMLALHQVVRPFGEPAR